MARLKRGRMRQVQRQSLTLRKVAFALSFAAIAGAVVFVLNNLGTAENAAANPGKDGAKTISAVNTIVNEYTYLTGNSSSGSTQIQCNSNTINANGRFSGNLAAGDLLLIIQMQGATINTGTTSTYGSVSSYNGCGAYEFAKVTSIGSSGKINLANGLRNSYSSSTKVQVVRVPRYTTLTINSGKSLTCPDWDGTTGGIIAVEASVTVVNNGTITANGKGFRGGVVEQNTITPGSPTPYRSTSSSDGAEKGESIAGLASSLSNGAYGRGAPANGGGGGNAHNGGGGGGANVGSGTWTGNGTPDTSTTNWKTAWNLESAGFASTSSPGGGRGGYSWSSNIKNPLTTAPGNSTWGGDNRQVSGGLGGRILDNSSNTRVFMGGGGGAGDSNNNTGTSGADGGGIIFILSKGNISGTGSITANGDTPPNTSSCTTCYGDAAGGGGGGGSVIVFSHSGTISNQTITARGGNGGTQNIITSTGECESPGGGGGGGYIATSTRSSGSVSVAGGVNGSTDSPPMTTFTPNGATKGGAGLTVTLTSAFNPYSASANPLPVTLVSFSVVSEEETALAEWETASEINNDYFLVERSEDGVNFELTGRVTGSGTTTSTRRYQLRDYAPLSGTSYYRLKQVDYDGKTEIFKVLPYEHNRTISELKIVECSPNPFTTSVRLTVDVPADGIINTELFTINGTKVWEGIAVQRAGRQLMNVYPEVNVPGVYLLRISDADGHSSVMRIMKK